MELTENLKNLVMYFLFLAKKRNKPLTLHKLQKLIYYAQAWSLVLNNKKLFEEEIEAWIHGPTIRSLYLYYQRFGLNPIEEEIDTRIESKFTDENKDLLNQVWKVYSKYDADYLEYLTHQELPWQKAREECDLNPNPFFPPVISTDLMKEYYYDKLMSRKKR
jgi:uncharacterized phage-associated protein